MRYAREMTGVLLRWFCCLGLACDAVAAVDVACGEETAATATPNVLLICVDDLRPELGCYGVGHIDSPHIDALAARGTLFTRHYVQAPTCGASRFALLTGHYGPRGNDALFQRARAMPDDERTASDERDTNLERSAVPVSLPGWLKQHGMTTVALGKVSHHPGGRGGRRWNDPSVEEMPQAWTRQPVVVGPWQDPEGWMHGLADGEIRVVQPGRRDVEMDVLQSVPGPDTRYPDGLVVEAALEEIDTLAAAGQPFFLAVGLLRPHLPLGVPQRYVDRYDGVALPPIASPEKPRGRTTWHGSGEFMKYDRQGRDPNTDAAFADLVRRHYAACVSYADAQVGKLLAQLEAAGLADSTTVVLWGDHGWHLGEHAVWGKHTLFERSLHAPLLIAQPGQQPRRIEAVVETIDLFPTVCEASGQPQPNELPGQSLLGETAAADGGTAVSYHNQGTTIRDDRYRLVRHRDGFVELYDHRSDPDETQNIAAQSPAIVAELSRRLDQRLTSRVTFGNAK